MASMRLSDLIPVLQTSIGPVILISGVGLLLLTLTNRFGRAVDRSRHLAREMRDLPGSDRGRLSAQVQILFRRAHLIRFAITMAALSVLLASILIISLFVMALLKWEIAVVLVLIFICCLGSLVASLIAFIQEIHLSLVALKLELDFQDQDK